MDVGAVRPATSARLAEAFDGHGCGEAFTAKGTGNGPLLFARWGERDGVDGDHEKQLPGVTMLPPAVLPPIAVPLHASPDHVQPSETEQPSIVTCEEHGT